MTAKAGFMAVVAVLVGALWEAGLSAQSAPAEEQCLATPNAPPPQGSHWYYHLNRIKQSKCWYLRTEGQAIPKPVLREDLEADVVAKVPRVTALKADRDTGPEPQELRPIQTLPAAPGQAGPRAVPWPDPPSVGAADDTASPDPPLPVTANGGVEGKDTVMVADSGKDTSIGAGVDRWVATTIAISGSPSEMPITLLLTFAVGLTISGMLVRQVARIGSARRRTIHVDRRTCDGTHSFVSEPGIPKAAAPVLGPVSSRVDDSCLNDEVKETHRILAQVLGQ